jgi:hypothetical protein
MFKIIFLKFVCLFVCFFFLVLILFCFYCYKNLKKFMFGSVSVMWFSTFYSCDQAQFWERLNAVPGATLKLL